MENLSNLKKTTDQEKEEKVKKIAKMYFDLMCERYNSGGLDLQQSSNIDEKEEKSGTELDNECTFCMEVLPAVPVNNLLKTNRIQPAKKKLRGLRTQDIRVKLTCGHD